MERADRERRLTAILSADAVGYSRLMAEDDAATVATLGAHRDAIEALVRAHRGRVVDAPGDNLLTEFPSALDATRCALEIQRELAERNAELIEERRMPFRVGVHLGDVLVEGERIYGDGVNVAARLEALAEPGGVCLSASVHDQVRDRLELDLEDLGEKGVKNFPHPVRVYRARAAAARAPDPTVPGFSGRPALAVLPFDNLSGDPEQEYFADGIAEDLITLLSAYRSFPVIARNSSFVYKGRAVDVKQVSRELGVRYLVEGSVRRAGSRVRVTAQLIDAAGGHHVWAQRYDRELSDLFELQDELTQSIAGAISPELQRSEWERLRRAPESLDVWDLTQRALWHFYKFEADENERARALFRRAIELDPDSPGAPYGGLASTHAVDLVYFAVPHAAEAVAEARAVSTRGLEVDDQNAGLVAVHGLMTLLSGDREGAISLGRRATELNPSFPIAWMVIGLASALACRSDEAIEAAERAHRLSPHDPMGFAFAGVIAMAHLAAGRDEEAVAWGQRALQLRKSPLTHRTLAAALGHLGRLDEARAALDSLLEMQPGLTLDVLRIQLAAATPELFDRLVDGLRKAGWKG